MDGDGDDDHDDDLHEAVMMMLKAVELLGLGICLLSLAFRSDCLVTLALPVAVRTRTASTARRCTPLRFRRHHGFRTVTYHHL